MKAHWGEYWFRDEEQVGNSRCWCCLQRPLDLEEIILRSLYPFQPDSVFFFPVARNSRQVVCCVSHAVTL